MHILLVTDSYPPEIRSASLLMFELAEELHSRGHIVTVITTWPSYNLDLRLNKKEFSEMEIENGINVLRIKTLPHHNVGYLIRGLSQLIMPLQFISKILKYKLTPDVVIIYSPPLPLGLVGIWLKTRRSKFILNIQDIFPQNAIDLGILKNKFQISFFQKMEKWIYEHANIITAHSEGNYKALICAHNQIKHKLHILHNWVEIDNLKVSKKDGFKGINYRERWNIKHKYIAIFAGVFGPSQYLKLLLDIAARMMSNSELLFLLVGDGAERKSLEDYACKLGLNNVRFEGFISQEDYPALLNSCDIGVVCLSPQNKTPVVPGKILGYMSAGMPIVAFIHQASDAWSVIQKSECGVVKDSADLDSCVLGMQNLMECTSQFKLMGLSGKKYALDNFSKDTCISKIEEMLI